MRIAAALLLGGLSLVPPAMPAMTPQEATQQIPLPQGVTLHEYPWVEPEDRTDVIELAEELVYLEVPPPRGTQVDMAGIAADERGRVYVGRPIKGGVDVFDTDGAALGKLGAYSPDADAFIGEAHSLVTMGDEILVVDRFGELSVWSSNGASRGEYPLREGGPYHAIAATGAGEVVMMQRRGIEDRARSRLLSVTRDGAEGAEYFELGYDEAATMTIGDRRRYDLFPWGSLPYVPRDRPTFAAFRDGTFYAAAAGAYEIVAKSRDGDFRWALRVPAPRHRFVPTQVQRDRIATAYEYHPPDDQPGPDDIHWPEYEPVIDRIDVDGDGNLYVYPWFDAVTRRGELRPVDVYSPEGERLLTALVPDFDWQDARGDQVYGIKVDPFTYVATAVRYRLVLPGAR